MATTGSSSSVAAEQTAAAAARQSTLDLVVGLPALDAGRSAEAIAAARGSLEPYRRVLNCGIVVSRPQSPDSRATPAAGGSDVIEARYATHTTDALDVPFHGMPARARAVHAILQEARAREARVCVIADPRSPLDQAWIDPLARPLLEEAVDLVKPFYMRHPYRGGVAHGIVYPLFRALYGLPLRYPLGGDFACSRRAVEALADDAVWQNEPGQLGIDWWISATALARNLRTGEAFLGDRPDDRTGLDLGAVLTQVLGICFSDMERRAAVWHRIRHAQDVPRFGTPGRFPPAPEVDAAALADAFRRGAGALEEVWAEVLPPLAILQWRRLARTPGVLHVDDGLWARTIFDFAMGYRLRVIARDHLLASLAPLYLGWLASFVGETERQSAEAADARIERLGRAFETEKPYLISQWRWPERFKPMKAHR